MATSGTVASVGNRILLAGGLRGRGARGYALSGPVSIFAASRSNLSATNPRLQTSLPQRLTATALNCAATPKAGYLQRTM